MKGSALLLVAAFAATGCGAEQAVSTTRGPGVNTADKRGTALACIRDRGFDARGVGEDVIQIGDSKTGPRIQFYVSSGEAEGEQFQGRGEGSEQIGSALLYTRGATEKQLDELEDCLMDSA